MSTPLDDDLTERFLSLGCLTYVDDDPASWARARHVLIGHPALTRTSIHAAAAAADEVAIGRILDADPAAATRAGGPRNWPPLLYLAYSRVFPEADEAAVVGSAQRLLADGADPNSGFLQHDLPTPFTALTGAFGHGELGPERQPPHACSTALARVLLEAGADPNDAQALYNRMFEPADDHLEVLFEFGLGQVDGTPWRRRARQAIDSPAALLRSQLSWAITHGMTRRVRLLLGHGASVSMPLSGDHSAADLAAVTGHHDLVDELVAHGSPPLALDAVDSLLAAALAADRDRAELLMAADPGLMSAARARRPALAAWAATLRRPEVIELVVDLGFDINAKGRTDVLSNQKWETALHQAASVGDVAVAEVLLERGADPDSHDKRFDATPLGWAQHFDQREMVALLEPVTSTAR